MIKKSFLLCFLFSVVTFALDTDTRLRAGFHVVDLFPSTDNAVWHSLDEKDRVALENKLQEIHAAAKELHGQANVLQTMSDDSLLFLTHAVELKTFVPAVRDFEKKMRAFRERAEGFDVLHKTIPEFKERKHLFERATSYFAEIERSVSKRVDSMQFNLRKNNGEILRHRGVETRGLLENAGSSAKERRDLRNGITVDRIMRSEDRTQIETLCKYTHQTLSIFLKTYGNGQIFRYNENEKGLERDVRKITDLFMARSYLRTMYQTRLGVLGLSYQKQAAHLDLFSGSSVNILSQCVTSDAVIQKLYDDVNSAYKAHQTKIGEGSWNWMVSSFAQLFNMFRGETQLAARNTFVFELLANDMEEEMKVGDPAEDLATHFKTRYYVNEESKARNKKLLKDLFKEGAIREVSVDSLQGVIGAVLPAFKNFEDQAGESRFKQELLQQIADANNPLSRERADRANELDL